MTSESYIDPQDPLDNDFNSTLSDRARHPYTPQIVQRAKCLYAESSDHFKSLVNEAEFIHDFVEAYLD